MVSKRGCAPALQGFVQTLPAETGVFGDLGHASRFGHITERSDKHIGIRIFGSRRKIFRDDCIVIEILRRVTDTPLAMAENGNNMIGEGTTVSALRRLSTPSTVPLAFQHFAANSLFSNTLRVSLYS